MENFSMDLVCNETFGDYAWMEPQEEPEVVFVRVVEGRRRQLFRDVMPIQEFEFLKSLSREAARAFFRVEKVEKHE